MPVYPSKPPVGSFPQASDVQDIGSGTRGMSGFLLVLQITFVQGLRFYL